MKYVLDSSVALRWVLPEPDSDKADRLRDDFRNATHELLAPDVFPVEARVASLWTNTAHPCPRQEFLACISRGHPVAWQLFAATYCDQTEKCSNLNLRF